MLAPTLSQQAAAAADVRRAPASDDLREAVLDGRAPSFRESGSSITQLARDRQPGKASQDQCASSPHRSRRSSNRPRSTAGRRQRLAAAISDTDVRLVLTGHTHRVSARTLAGVPVWVSPSTGSHADVFAGDGFRGHAGGGFTRVDILDDGDIVATFVPLTGRDEILYDIQMDQSQLRPAG
jgi:hypothetical protein